MIKNCKERNGTIFYDGKVSRWLTTDPAVMEYMEGSAAGGGAFDYVSLNLYHYAGKSPLRYTDPDGRMKRDENGKLVFIPDTDKNGNPVTEKKTAQAINPQTGREMNKDYEVTPGYLTADDGRKIRAYKNNTDDRNLDTNCIGTAFADGKYWINPDQVEGIINGDGYEQIADIMNLHDIGNIQIGDIIVYEGNSPLRVNNSLERAIHASIVKGISGRNLFVDSKNGGSPIKNNVSYLSKDATVPGVQGGYVWGKR